MLTAKPILNCPTTCDNSGSLAASTASIWCQDATRGSSWVRAQHTWWVYSPLPWLFSELRGKGLCVGLHGRTRTSGLMAFPPQLHPFPHPVTPSHPIQNSHNSDSKFTYRLPFLPRCFWAVSSSRRGKPIPSVCLMAHFATLVQAIHSYCPFWGAQDWAPSSPYE